MKISHPFLSTKTLLFVFSHKSNWSETPSLSLSGSSGHPSRLCLPNIFGHLSYISRTPSPSESEYGLQLIKIKKRINNKFSY